jgi:hypothetical protein
VYVCLDAAQRFIVLLVTPPQGLVGTTSYPLAAGLDAIEIKLRAQQGLARHKVLLYRSTPAVVDQSTFLLSRTNDSVSFLHPTNTGFPLRLTLLTASSQQHYNGSINKGRQIPRGRQV